MTAFNPKLITNNPDLHFQDIGDEMWRKYEFPDGTTVLIEEPTAVAVKAPTSSMTIGGGSHRVLDSTGVSHYIPQGWVHLTWQNKTGKLPFAF